MPQNAGDKIHFRRYESLGLATTPLNEGTNPDGRNLSVTDIQASLQQYGDYVHITDQVDLMARDPVLTETAELLGEQMGKTRDVLVRDAILRDYVERIQNDGESKVDVSGSISDAELETAVDDLLTADARFITGAIRPSTGYNTVPIRPAYVAIFNPNQRKAVEAFSDFVPVSEYPSNENVLDGEWGAVKNVRFVMSTQADNGELDTWLNNHSSLSSYTNGKVLPIFAADAYGVTELTGGAAANIVKVQGGTSDPLELRRTSGWKMLMTAMVLNPKFMTMIVNWNGDHA